MWRKNLDTQQTIFALTTGALPSAIAIVKLSGPAAFAAARRIFKRTGGEDLPREAGVFHGELHGLCGQKLDDVLLLAFVAPHSHSGEDTVEFHCHGSPPIIRALEQSLLEIGARPAEKGEFSYRAFLNGKVSVNALEDLADIFAAKEPSDLTRIYERRDAALASQVELLRQDLVHIQAILDTAVDFSEEYGTVSELVEAPIERVIRGCSQIIQRYSHFRDFRPRPRLVLAGRPNAGKSSLFNALLCRYRAIVHDEPGTTRDVIEESVEIGGREWRLADTAGVRPAGHVTEREGMELGEDYLAACACWILVVDGTKGLQADDLSLLKRFGEKPLAVVWNKTDLPECQSLPKIDRAVVPLSASKGEGLETLWAVLLEVLPSRSVEEQQPLPRATHVVRLQQVLGKLEQLKKEWRSQVPPEYLSERNRQIIGELEGLVGAVDTEAVLDRIFHDFCIGK